MSAPRLTIERFRPAVIGENGQGGDVERIRLARAAAIEAIGTDVPTHRMRAPIYTDTQLEALPPDQLAAIVRNAIDERLDRDAYEDVRAQEEEVRAAVLAGLAGNPPPRPPLIRRPTR